MTTDINQTETHLLNNGYTMPSIGLGCSHWGNDEGTTHETVVTAIKAGYRHIDTAERYETEKEIGSAVKDCITEGIVRRDELFITSKLWISHTRPDLVEGACRRSLARLQMDYLDLYVIHFPVGTIESVGCTLLSGDEASERGLFSSIDHLDTWKAMENLLDAGIVRGIGLSNFSTSQIERIVDQGRTKPVCNQIEVSPYCQNIKVLQYCQSLNITVVAFCPLGSPGRFKDNPDHISLLSEPCVTKIAADRGKTPAQIVLRWGLQRGYCLIPKSLTPSRIIENIKVFDFHLNDEEMASISGIKRKFRAVKFKPYMKDPRYPFTEDTD